MIQLDLSREEEEIFSEILECYLSDLRMEIAGTERLDFRNRLKIRKKLVMRVLEQLQQNVATPA
ncbi:MAG: hypothetical protein GWN62_33230 [Aliifodinibius sp.]|nr:hypothetical protein [Fodinibius sp.]